MRHRAFLLLSLVGFCALPRVTSAATVVHGGTTIGGALWNRPLAGTPPTALSAVGTATPYEVLPLHVDVSGTYSFLSTVTGWDNFLFLYVGSFDPLQPLMNALTGNDDYPTIGISGFDYSLTAGQNYSVVTTGFSNSDAGVYELTIDGPGNITLQGISTVPEPAAGALFLGGLAALGQKRRRSSIGRNPALR